MIEDWLQEFKDAWITRDIDRVMNLFADDAEYWETPFRKLSGKDEIRHEWQAIERQKDIDLRLSVYATDFRKHTVLWNLSYSGDYSDSQHWSGAYLIELDETGKCMYFHQTGETCKLSGQEHTSKQQNHP